MSDELLAKKSTPSNAYNEIVEERYAVVVWLYLIKREVDNKIKEQKEQGQKQSKKIGVFASPSFIWKHFGGLLPTPLYTEIATLRGHTTHGVSCLTLHENKLYSGSDDKTIRIWNTETHEEIAILRGHTDCVNCLTLHENKLYSGSGGENTIFIWNTETHEYIATLEGHTDNVKCLAYHENKLYSGSKDNTIRIWNTETNEEVATLREHTDIVCGGCLTLHKNKLYSGSMDRTIRVWKVA